jgi:hypothetical protein
MSSNDKQDKSDTPRMDATLGKGSDWVFAEGCRLERELAESRQMHAELQREIEKMAANTFRSHAAPVAADPQPLPGTACKAIYDEAIAVAQREKPLGSSADWISTALVHVYAAGQRSITRSASGGSSEPRGGPWNVGDQQEPDGYVVLIKDAGSAKRGYWLSHAYVDRSFADRGAEACKGEVMPIYFAQSSASIPQDTADTLRDLIDYACAFVPLTWEGRQTHQEIMKRGLQLLAAIDASESKNSV